MSSPRSRVHSGNLVGAGRTLACGVATGGLMVSALTLDASTTPAEAAPGQPGGRASAPTAAVVSPTASLGRPAARAGHRWPGHPGRRIVAYRVRHGDSATRIAVRFHAWTAELLALNHKRPGSFWYVGERVRVPVVIARVPHHESRHHKPRHHKPRHHEPRHHEPRHHKPRHHAGASAYHPSRVAVREEIRRVARHYGVRPHLAMAIAWQESGWQQDVRSSAGAVGTMQVLPSTGRWISTLVGRRLHLWRLHDNVVAGVVLFDLLRSEHGVRRSLAGYYQGIGSVQAHGLYRSTRRYVRSVVLHWRLLNRGWRPLH